MLSHQLMLKRRRFVGWLNVGLFVFVTVVLVAVAHSVRGTIDVAVVAGVVVLSGVHIVGGIGLLLEKRWGALVLWPVSILDLVGFPIGTLLGLYNLYILHETREQTGVSVRTLAIVSAVPVLLLVLMVSQQLGSRTTRSPATPLLDAQEQVMRHLELRSGLALDLPLAWQLRDSSNVRLLRDTAQGLMKTMKLDTSAVRAATLLIADGPGQAEAILGVGPAPGVTSRYFAGLSSTQLEAYRNKYCERVSEVVRAQSRSLPDPTCGALVRDSVKQRDALVMRTDLAEPDGTEHAFYIQVATSDAVVTLTLISRRGSPQVDIPVFRRIWRSLVVPDTLSGLPN